MHLSEVKKHTNTPEQDGQVCVSTHICECAPLEMHSVQHPMSPLRHRNRQTKTECAMQKQKLTVIKACDFLSPFYQRI